MAADVIEMKGIVKRFPGVVANDRVDFAVQGGEVRALVGENGAGKTTLMNVLYGLYRPDEGQVLLRGRPVSFASSLEAIRAGIGMVHQHFMLFPSLTVADNVIYGSEPTRRGLVDPATARRRVVELAERYGLQIDPDRKVSELPVGIEQRVEILKALYRRADVLVLDEPTAVLTPQEKDGLFRFLRELSEMGKTVILITHKLEEVMEISDHATVMRNGRVTANLRTAATTPAEICRHMVGRDVLLRVDKTPSTPGDPVLAISGVQAQDLRGMRVLDNVSLEVRAGEIVGVAGVAGNGQTELVEAIVGTRPVDGGVVAVGGKEVTERPVGRRRADGLAYVPEDRGGVGLAPAASVADNLAMGFHRDPRYSRWSVLLLRKLLDRAAALVGEFSIKSGSVTEPASALSGGNLQKVILARELDHKAPLLIAEQPTRGLDVGATELVHRTLVGYRDRGHAILLVSADLSEILSLSDRIYVMYRGQIVGEVAAAGADEHRLGLLMAGIVDRGPGAQVEPSRP
jgi:general nucleoside transport system ATP-binding protein